MTATSYPSTTPPLLLLLLLPLLLTQPTNKTIYYNHTWGDLSTKQPNSHYTTTTTIQPPILITIDLLKKKKHKRSSNNNINININHWPFHCPRKNADKILDAPDLIDEFSINVLDWSKSNTICIGLNTTVYLWDEETSAIDQLHEVKSEDAAYISSTKFADKTAAGNVIAVGQSNGVIHLFDLVKKERFLSLRSSSHGARVGALGWNGNIVTSGDRDGKVVNHDLRTPQHEVSRYLVHGSDICGLAWTGNAGNKGRFLGTGSNDSKVCVFEFNQMKSVVKKPFRSFGGSLSGVRALAWCPWQDNLLGTGSGAGDESIRVYDIGSNQCVKQVFTDSEVCSLEWNRYEEELVTSHGPNGCQLSVWDYRRMTKRMEMVGHSGRVLHTALSPCGSRICSAAADETLRFWSVFKIKEKGDLETSSLQIQRLIR